MKYSVCPEIAEASLTAFLHGGSNVITAR